MPHRQEDIIMNHRPGLLLLYTFCLTFFGFGLIAYIQALLMYRFFRKYLPDEKETEQK